MSKQKTFWGTYTTDKRHLWTIHEAGYKSSCGLLDLFPHASSEGNKCKNCLRAIEN